MKLAFAEIPQEKTCYSLGETGWFPVAEIAFRPPVQAEIEIRRRTSTTALLKGRLQFSALLQCDRCAAPVERLLQEEFEYTITLEEHNNPELSELECSEEDCNTLYLKEPVIDFGAILREQALLAVPTRTLCTEDCRGLCLICGAILKNENCGCSTAGSNSPFAVLERLRKA